MAGSVHHLLTLRIRRHVKQRSKHKSDVKALPREPHESIQAAETKNGYFAHYRTLDVAKKEKGGLFKRKI